MTVGRKAPHRAFLLTPSERLPKGASFLWVAAGAVGR